MFMTFPDTPRARSIRQQLTNLAGTLGIRSMEAMRLYFLDGFMVRLAQSGYQGQFILGGGLFLYKVVLGPTRTRVTQDSDFTILGLSQSQVTTALQTIMALPAGDELVFDPLTLIVQSIITTQPQMGLRARIAGQLGHASDRVTLDLAFDPVPWPGPQWRNVPATLPHQPVIPLLTYPLEGIMAGKVEGMLRRGATNTRFKDYYDLYRLAQTQQFAATDLEHALRDMCHQHNTPFAPNAVFLDPAFPADPFQVSGWQRFVNATRVPGSMPGFAEAIDFVRRLYLPLLQGAVSGQQWDHTTYRWQ
jgi:hypothetical protein